MYGRKVEVLCNDLTA